MNITPIIYSLPNFFRRHKVIKLILFLSPKSRTQLITFNGNSKLFIDVSDPFARSYFFVESYDPEFFSIAKPFLAKGGICFDVGGRQKIANAECFPSPVPCHENISRGNSFQT